MKNFLLQNKNNPWFWTFVTISVALLFAMSLMSRTTGNSGDEDGFQIPQGDHVVNYFKTSGQDTTCLHFRDVMQYYGSSFDVIAAFVADKFKVEDINILRHKLNALAGWLAILAVGLIAYKLAGFRAACFAMILLFLSPRFLGHSFNNPKDAPFAAGVIFSIYGMVLFFKQFPKVRWYTYLILVLSIAYAISIRIGGLILFGYFGFFGLMFLIKWIVDQRKQRKTNKAKTPLTDRVFARFLKLAAMGIGICVAGYFLGLLLWPYAMQSPIKNPLEAFGAMSKFATSIRQVFEGSMQWSDYLPWYYTPKYIMMTIPIAVIVGLVLFFVFCWRKKEDRLWSFFIFFTFFFPVFWIVYTHANVYGGWRHAMFAYPPMVVAAGLGFDGIVRWVEEKVQNPKSKVQSSNKEEQPEIKSKKPLVVNICAVAFLLILLIGPIRHIIANHPYEYVYFNELVGGTKNQLGNYELDYYYHSTREASEWILANAEKKEDGSKTIVATWHTASVQYFFRKDTNDFQVRFVRWYEKENSDWDYAIFTVTGMAPSYLRSANFPPKNTVKTIDVDGVPIAIILKREDKSDCQAFAMKQDPSKLDSVVMLYQKALQKDPDNLGALLNIGETYVRMSKPDSALIYLNHYYEIDAESEMANYMRAYAYVYKNDANTALDVLHKIQKHNPKYVASYILAVQLHLQKKDYVAAKKEFMKAIDVDQMNDQLTQLWIQYCAMQNIDQNNAYIQLYKLMAKSCEKRGKEEEAKRYLEAIGR